MVYFAQQAALDSSPVTDAIDLSKAITEYGILIVIAAIFLIVTCWIMRRMINSYSKTIDGIIPKLEELSKAINDLQRTTSEMINAHNAHSNQSLRTIERDSKEIRESFSHYQKSIMELESAVSSLQSNYNTLLRIIIGNNGSRLGNNSLPNPFIVDYDVPTSNYSNDDKKDGDGSN